MSRWLPPAGAGYSGRSVKSCKKPNSGATEKTIVSERFPKVASGGSAGVSRAK